MSGRPRILVTGATGELGRGVVSHLIARGAAPSSIAALARDPAKAADLSARGVDVRRGDYADPDPLRSAFTGIERLLLISATAFSDAVTLHDNVINAARDAGVGSIVYTAIQRSADSRFTIEQVTAWDVATERMLAESGMAVTIARHGLYVDSLPSIIGPQVGTGVIRAAAGDGRAALVLRDNLAAAHATILLGEGHDGLAYTLTGPEAVSMADVASAAARGLGHPVRYEAVSRDDYVALREADGLPAPVAGFMSSWFEAIGAHQFAPAADLARLLGREPASALDWLTDHYAGVAGTRS